MPQCGELEHQIREPLNDFIPFASARGSPRSHQRSPTSFWMLNVQPSNIQPGFQPSQVTHLRTTGPLCSSRRCSGRMEKLQEPLSVQAT